jgi:hypothetical protein
MGRAPRLEKDSILHRSQIRIQPKRRWVPFFPVPHRLVSPDQRHPLQLHAVQLLLPSRPYPNPCPVAVGFSLRKVRITYWHEDCEYSEAKRKAAGKSGLAYHTWKEHCKNKNRNCTFFHQRQRLYYTPERDICRSVEKGKPSTPPSEVCACVCVCACQSSAMCCVHLQMR